MYQNEIAHLMHMKEKMPIGYCLCKMVSSGQKLKKNVKNMGKTILQEHLTCSVQKNARKNTKYWRNKTIFKVDDLAKAIAYAKAIAFAKWLVWVNN